MENSVTTIRGGTVIVVKADSVSAQRLDLRFADSGRITELAPDLPAVAGETVIDASGMIVMPGLIDSHRHSWQALMRGISTDQTVVEYRSLARGRLAARYRPEDVYAATLFSDQQAINAGITTVADFANIMNSPEHADAAIQAHRDSGLRAFFCHGEPNDMEVASWYHNSSRRHPDDIHRLRQDVLHDDDARVTLGLKIRPPFLVTPEVLEYDLRLGRELGLHIMMDGGLGGGCWNEKRWGDEGLAPIRDIDKLGQLGPHLTLVHCNNLTDDDFALIARTGTHVSTSPEHEMLCGHGLPPAIKMLKHNIHPALSTDSFVAVSCDMFAQMRALLTATRGGLSDAAYRSGDAIWTWDIRSEDVLRSATLASAAACGLADRVGSLDPGKRADIVLLKSDPLNLSLFGTNPIANLVSSVHPGNVDIVIVDGVVVKSGGKLLSPRVDSVIEAAQASSSYILEGIEQTNMDNPRVDKWAMFA